MAVEQHTLLAGTSPSVADIHTDAEHIVRTEGRFLHTEVGIGVGGIAQSGTEGPLHINLSIVVISSGHGAYALTGFVVVGGKGVGESGIGEGKLATEVGITGEQVGQGFSTIVRRKHGVHYTSSEGFDVGNNARAAAAEHQHEGFAGFTEGMHQTFLVFREIEVRKVTGSLAIAGLADAADNDICRGSGKGSLFDAGGLVGIPLRIAVVGHGIFHTCHIADAVLSELLLHRLQDGLVVLSHKLVGAVALPGIAPSAIEAAERIGVRSGDKDALSGLQRQHVVLVLQQHDALFGGLTADVGKFLAAELRIFRGIPGRMLEEPEAVFQAQYACHGIVDTRHGHQPLLDGLL